MYSHLQDDQYMYIDNVHYEIVYHFGPLKISPYSRGPKCYEIVSFWLSVQ